MSFAVFAQVAEEAEHHVGLLDTIGYGILALGVFALLGLVTLSYRNVANRHAGKSAAYAAAHGKTEHGEGAGH